MSQGFQFRKLTNFFSEEVTQDFSQEKVYDSLKILLMGTEQYSDEYVKKYFEHITLKYLQINTSQIEKIIPKFDEQLQFSLFDPTKTTFMVDPKIWAAIEEIAWDRIKDITNAEDATKGKLKKITGISSEYSLLENIHKNKLLFVNIF